MQKVLLPALLGVLERHSLFFIIQDYLFRCYKFMSTRKELAMIFANKIKYL